MAFSIAPLLMYDPRVPAAARDALRAAYAAPADHRDALLQSAARILHESTGLECGDVRELVGLSGHGSCD
ncbi:MAG TPA: hypothetical protein VE987_14995 [Polyangiaceae bacterium]|nr:hypothetical protein [Polyangiaceae bacterium]